MHVRRSTEPFQAIYNPFPALFPSNLGDCCSPDSTHYNMLLDSSWTVYALAPEIVTDYVFKYVLAFNGLFKGVSKVNQRVFR